MRACRAINIGKSDCLVYELDRVGGGDGDAPGARWMARLDRRMDSG
jgi:hypothetical protein